MCRFIGSWFFLSSALTLIGGVADEGGKKRIFLPTPCQPVSVVAFRSRAFAQLHWPERKRERKGETHESSLSIKSVGRSFYKTLSKKK